MTEEILFSIVSLALTKGWTFNPGINCENGVGIICPPENDIRNQWATEWIFCETLNCRVPCYIFGIKKKNDTEVCLALDCVTNGSELLREGDIQE